MRYQNYSQSKWRNDTHAEQGLSRSKLWCEPIGHHFDELRTVTKKTASIVTLASFLHVFLRVQGPILAEKMKPKWRRQKFRAWRAGKVAREKAWKTLVFDGKVEDNNFKSPVYLVYGGAKFSASSPGLHSTPTTSMYQSAAHMAKVTGNFLGVQDEFRTSCKCGSCGETMARVKTTLLTPRQQSKNAKSFERWGRVNPHVETSQTIRGLYACVNPSCPNDGRRLKHRDRAATGNMMQTAYAAFLGESRPEYLQRGGPKVVYPPSVWLSKEPHLPISIL